jgi:prolyl oligopeptidase
MTQRPELMKVALPAVGVMDMLRYHTFTAGAGCLRLRNSQDSKEMFEYIKGYSPVQNVKAGTISSDHTGDHDDSSASA